MLRISCVRTSVYLRGQELVNERQERCMETRKKEVSDRYGVPKREGDGALARCRSGAGAAEKELRRAAGQEQQVTSRQRGQCVRPARASSLSALSRSIASEISDSNHEPGSRSQRRNKETHLHTCSHLTSHQESTSGNWMELR